MHDGTDSFSLAAGLTVTTGRLYADIAEVQILVERLLDRPVLTHELGQGLREARPIICRQFPWLASIQAPSGVDTPEATDKWIKTLTDARLPARLAPRSTHA